MAEKYKRFRGTPPPPTFDLAALADDQLLASEEVAAVLRMAIGTVEGWRYRTHPLRFFWLNGRVFCTAGNLRAYIAEYGTAHRVGRPYKVLPPSSNPARGVNP